MIGKGGMFGGVRRFRVGLLREVGRRRPQVTMRRGSGGECCWLCGLSEVPSARLRGRPLCDACSLVLDGLRGPYPLYGRHA